MTAPSHSFGPAGPQPLTAASSDRSLSFLQALINRRASIDIGAERKSLWLSRLNPLLAKHGLADIEELVASLMSGNRDLEQAVVDAMTTNETMFFRDGQVFGDIVKVLVPRLLERSTGGGRLTIWSAACSSGQEVYSLAMLLARHHPDLVRSGRIRILASDLSNSMVERCREARYSTLEVRRGLTDAHLAEYFDRDGDGWVVRRSLRDLVVSRPFNLMDPLDPIPRCDLVLVRNVLIYFSDSDKTALLRQIGDRVLRPQGALVLGSSELIGDAHRYYGAEQLPNGVCFQPRAD